jgi:3-hydroxybutyryl-CoA dehydrogenase
MSIFRVAVVGAGVMGKGIAQIFSLKGFEVALIDQNNFILDKALKEIIENFDKAVSAGIMTENDKVAALGNILLTEGYENMNTDTDLVVEAVPENKELKQSIFRYLNTQLKESCIFASNTSAISITELAAGCRPDRYIGIHFIYPAAAVKIVEVIRGYQTSQETIAIINELVEKLGKTPIEVFDSPGFVLNRLLIPMINEAVFALSEGVASVEGIDAVMRFGGSMSVGPLALADLIGLDACLNTMEILFSSFKDPKYRPAPILRKMVAAGKLGRKTNEGFYRYS